VNHWFNINNYANSGPVIGYRRVAGKFGITDKEDGVRGAWVEKRVALIKGLQANNYRVIPVSEFTDATREAGVSRLHDYRSWDILLLEFGGTNLQFYGKQWEETINLIKCHKGRIIFVNDDPDLTFLWGLLEGEDWSRWTVAANAVNTDAVSHALKCPDGVRVVDMPMHSGIDFAPFTEGRTSKLVYIGRPNGRGQYLDKKGMALAYSKHVQICGKPKEWADYEIAVAANPQQRDRRMFYRNFAGCLSIYDKKHAVTGWRTGRAYHALCAGIPVCAPVGNPALSWCYPIRNEKDVESFCKLSVDMRKMIWTRQRDKLILSSNQDLIKL